MRQTQLLRVLLTVFLVGLVAASGLLYIVSLDLAATYPELAHRRLPIYLAVIVGLIPVILAVQVMFEFLTLVDRGEAFSARTVGLLRRLKTLFGVAAVYLVLGLAGVWVALLPQQSPSVLLGWFAAEAVALFLLTLVALFERLFTTALELRHDNELTV